MLDGCKKACKLCGEEDQQSGKYSKGDNIIEIIFGKLDNQNVTFNNERSGSDCIIWRRSVVQSVVRGILNVIIQFYKGSKHTNR